MFEAILGDSLYHPITAYPGVGLDLEILAVDQPFDTITVRDASDPLKLVFPPHPKPYTPTPSNWCSRHTLNPTLRTPQTGVPATP